MIVTTNVDCFMKLFGTDGIRGTANQFPMTPEIALKFGMAAGHLLKNDGHRNRVVIAKDTRLSGYMLEPALTSGFISVGVDVILVGPMPTPSVPMLMKSLRADFGVMLSASHNPHHDNGIKFFSRDGNKLSDEMEVKLEALILSDKLNDFLVKAEDLGRAKRLEDAPGRYVEHVKRTFPKGMDLSGLRIVIDAANGAAYHLAPKIFWELGAEVVKIGVDPDGYNINNNCGSTHPQTISKKVVETRADIGIALDGDADRVLICDENGKVIHGDHLIGLIAKRMQFDGALKNDKIVVTHMSNGALDEYLETLGLSTERTSVGDRYVSEKMRETGANFGGEQSGHLIFSDYSTTGDGIIAALEVLATLISSNKKMSEIAEPFALNPQSLKNVKFVGENPLINPKVQEQIKKIENSYPELRFMIRKSGTERLIRILVEGKSAAEIKKSVAEVEKALLG